MSLPRTPFGKVCHLVNGKAFKPTDWSTAGVPIIRIQNLNGADKPFNHWAGTLDKQVLVKTGDLLLAWSGTPGTSFGAHIWSGPNGILNQHIFRCDLDEKAVTKEWARIAVNHRLHRLIEQAHGGVGLQHVTRGMVEELEIPLPPLAEQRRIAEVLWAADRAENRHRDAVASIDSVESALFLSAVTNSRATIGWDEVTFERLLLDSKYGSSRRSEHRSNSSVPMIRIPNVIAGRLELTDLAWITPTEEESEQFKLLRGDILIVRTNGNPDYVGRCVALAEFPSDAIYASYLIRLRVDQDQVRPEYLSRLINSPIQRRTLVHEIRSSAGNYNLNIPGILRQRTLLPPIPEQDRILAALRELRTAQDELLSHIESTNRLRKSLIHAWLTDPIGDSASV